eukprot:133901-Chlamydomonas_euryale.AAC.4
MGEGGGRQVLLVDALVVRREVVAAGAERTCPHLLVHTEREWTRETYTERESCSRQPANESASSLRRAQAGRQGVFQALVVEVPVQAPRHRERERQL